MKIINNHIENKLDHIKKILKDKLDQDKTITYYNSPVEIEYRIKNRKKFFSKAVKNKTFPKDIIGFRIVIDSENESLPYNILRNIELNYKTYPDTFKDYIKNKKDNDYMSLHICAVIDYIMIEIQIRNSEMDYSAKYGKASNYH